VIGDDTFDGDLPVSAGADEAPFPIGVQGRSIALDAAEAEASSIAKAEVAKKTPEKRIKNSFLRFINNPLFI
jgi:hypothetical protein